MMTKNNKILPTFFFSIIVFLFISLLLSSTAFAKENWHNAKWIWAKNDNRFSEKNFEISYDTKINKTASGFIFGSDTENIKNGYMWQFQLNNGVLYFRPHKISNGNFQLLSSESIPHFSGNPTGILHITIQSRNGTLTTRINGQVLTKAIDANAKIGELGFRESGSESATFDNLVIKDISGNTLRTEDFTATAVYGNDVQNGTLQIANKSIFLPSVSNAQRADTWADFRKTINIQHVPQQLPTKIAVDTKYWLYINGNCVVREGGLKRGPTRNDTWYDTIDIAKYLHSGKNTIAILAHYYGKKASSSYQCSGKAGLIFDANNISLYSDSSWKAQKDNHFIPTVNSDLLSDGRVAETDANYDARQSINDFLQSSYDDSKWQSAIEFGSADIPPWNKLIPRNIPQWKDYGLKNYTNSVDYTAYTTNPTSKNITLCMHLPYNMQFTPYLEIDAPAGIKIQSDHYADKRWHNTKSNRVKNAYITKNGRQTFEGFAWVNGENVYYEIPNGVKIIALKYRETGYNTEFTGRFNSNDDFYNMLWKKAARTTYLNMRDNYMDCPDRERAAWTGDLATDVLISQYAFDSNANGLYKKSLQTIIGYQKKDGRLQTIVPSENFSELPLQELALISGIYDYYLYTDDKDTLKAAYPMMKKYLNLYKLDNTNLVIHRGGTWDWPDWGDNADMSPLENAWVYYALKQTAKTANVLGYSADELDYHQKMDQIKEAYNKKFWNGHAYYHKTTNKKPDDRANAIAVISGIAEKDKYNAIATVLSSQKNASPYMERYVLEALVKMNRMDIAQERMKERYMPMVFSNEANSTLWEYWNKSSGTDNHGWSGGPLIIMSKNMAGIKPIEPGYRKWQIAPNLGSLNTINTTVPTVQGNINATIAKNVSSTKSTFRLSVNVPKGTTAQIVIPSDMPQTSVVTIDGHTYYNHGTVHSTNGITWDKATNNSLILTADGGRSYSIARTEERMPSLTIQAHVQKIGWMTPTSDDTTIGNPGNSESIEALKIQSTGNMNLGITGSVLVQGKGWTPNIGEDEIWGTTGESRHLEAIRLNVSPESAKDYDIYYRVYAQRYGWLGWTKNSLPAGTEGYNLRMEGLQIRIVKKGERINGKTSNAFITNQVHVVRFETGTHATITRQKVQNGKCAGRPKDPTRLGYRLTGWYTDKTYLHPWSFNQAITKDMTLYAGWQPKYKADISTSVHVQRLGWLDAVQDNAIAGTTGSGLRMEALRLNSVGPVNLGIMAQAHVQKIGWQSWKNEGSLIGTQGQSKRIEAIRIKLNREATNKYDVYYRVHAQHFGWMGWTKNGAKAGTAGYGYRLEALQIKVILKGSPAPFNDRMTQTDQSFIYPKVKYSVHVQRIGWQQDVKDGAIAGTSGKSLRLEAVKIEKGSDELPDGDITYRTHIQGTGWEKEWQKNNHLSGTSGRGLRLEAIQIKLTGDMAKKYDVYYRVHAQHFGDLGWAKNGEIAGTTGYGYRLEGLYIKLVPKNSKVSEETKKYYYKK